MKTFITVTIILLAGALLGVAFARAEDAPQHWKIVYAVIDHDQPLRFTYGAAETGPVYFPSEAACKDAIDKDDKVQKATVALQSVAKLHGAEDLGVTCVMDM